jgi:hypothetical protein
MSAHPIVTGTSVGAIHACFLASLGGARGGGERLAKLWRGMSLTGVYRLGISDVVRVPLWLLGRLGGVASKTASRDEGLHLPGLFDTAPLEEIVAREIDWARIHGNIQSGVIDALAVTAPRSRLVPVVFFDNREGGAEPARRPAQDRASVEDRTQPCASGVRRDPGAACTAPHRRCLLLRRRATVEHTHRCRPRCGSAPIACVAIGPATAGRPTSRTAWRDIARSRYLNPAFLAGSS